MPIDALHAVQSLAAAALGTTTARSDAPPPSAASTRAAADASAAVQARVDKLLAMGNTKLDFHIDPASRDIVLKIVDAQSGDLLYQIPSDVALNIAKWLDGTAPLLNRIA